MANGERVALNFRGGFNCLWVRPTSFNLFYEVQYFKHIKLNTVGESTRKCYENTLLKDMIKI